MNAEVRPRLLTLDEAGVRLGLSRKAIEHRIARGTFPLEVIRLGSGRSPLRVRETDVDALIDPPT